MPTDCSDQRRSRATKNQWMRLDKSKTFIARKSSVQISVLSGFSI